MKGFLEYVPGKSLLHRLNPVVKLICALLISVACFCTSNITILLAILILDFALAASCAMAKQALGLAKAVAFFSVILAIIALLTNPSGDVLINLPWGYIGTGSLFAAGLIIIRLVACAVPLFLVMYVTKLNDIANSCCKILHVPYKYAFTFTSAVHFIPVFMNDMSSIMESQSARGVKFDGSFVKKVRLMVPLCAPLLISSVRKTNSSAIAAEVRGFDLRTRQSGFKEYPIHGRDIAALLISVLILVGCILSSVLPPLM